MATNKQLDDCLILMAVCKALRQAIIMTVKMNFPRVCFQSDSLIVVNTVNGKSVVPTKIINIVEDIKLLLLGIREHRWNITVEIQIEKRIFSQEGYYVIFDVLFLLVLI